MSDRICSFPTCEKFCHARGLCDGHYQQESRVGRLVPLVGDTFGRFAWNVAVDDAGCWLWTGTVLKEGYGQFASDKRRWLAHRYSFELHNGPIPDGLEVDHLCRVRHCVNPDHLEAVTPLVNTRRARALVTHCPSGHAYSDDNVAPVKGYRCGTCHQSHLAKRRAERAAIRAA